MCMVCLLWVRVCVCVCECECVCVSACDYVCVSRGVGCTWVCVQAFKWGRICVIVCVCNLYICASMCISFHSHHHSHFSFISCSAVSSFTVPFANVRKTSISSSHKVLQKMLLKGKIRIKRFTLFNSSVTVLLSNNLINMKTKCHIHNTHIISSLTFYKYVWKIWNHESCTFVCTAVSDAMTMLQRQEEREELGIFLSMKQHKVRCHHFAQLILCYLLFHLLFYIIFFAF